MFGGYQFLYYFRKSSKIEIKKKSEAAEKRSQLYNNIKVKIIVCLRPPFYAPQQVVIMMKNEYSHFFDVYDERRINRSSIITVQPVDIFECSEE